MLWTMLILMSSIDFFLGTVGMARHVKAGLGGYAVTIVAGLILAVCNAWAVYQAGEIAIARVERYSESRREWGVRALFTALFLWCFVAVALGAYVGHMFVRLAV